MTTKLLTEAEAAARLRCSALKIKRLRQTGRLAFLPGRPPLLTEAAIDAYIEAAQCPASPHIAKLPKAPPAEVNAAQWVREKLARRGSGWQRGSGAGKARIKPASTETVAGGSSRKPKTEPSQD